jgi:endonuclease YncB( thermonuclease family)
MTVRRSTGPARRKLTRLALIMIIAGAVWLLGGEKALREWIGGARQEWKQGEPRDRERVTASRVRVIDGDTFEIDGRRIRVLGMDAPEMGQSGPDGEDLGEKASAEASRIVKSASRVEYLPYRNDSYGRLLAHVLVDGGLFAEKMIAAGMAYESVSHYGDNGFPDLAARIEKAARQAGTPDYEPPWLWRREHKRVRGEKRVSSAPGPSASGAASVPATP